MVPLDIKSSVMKHVTVSRILLIVVLGCAAMSVHWAFQTKSECVTLCTDVNPSLSAADCDSRLHTTVSPSVSSTTPNHSIFELPSRKRDYKKNEPHRSVVRITTTAGSDQLDLKGRTVPVLLTSHAQSPSPFHVPASVDAECMVPLFCSSRLVRNCVTNEIIGHVPDSLRSQRMKSPKSRSVETSHMRRQSFKKVFDSRAWGHDWDIQHRGLNASGE